MKVYIFGLENQKDTPSSPQGLVAIVVVKRRGEKIEERNPFPSNDALLALRFSNIGTHGTDK
jgi:hypothetical protein